jgi:hypothetical protein
MRSTFSHKILSILLIAVLIATQFTPGFSVILHAEEGGSTVQDSSSDSSADSSSSDNADSSNSSDSASSGASSDSLDSDESVTNSSDDSNVESESRDQNNPPENINTESDSESTESNSDSESELKDDSSSVENISDTTGTEEISETEEQTDSQSTDGSDTISGSVNDSLGVTATTTETAQVTESATTTTSTSTDSTELLIDNSNEEAPIATTTLTTTSTSTEATTTTQVSTTTDTATTTPNISTSTPEILSGRAVAMANILNILNMNMVNSEGAILLSNFIDSQYGTVDLRGGTDSTCSLGGCTSEGIHVNLLNTAEIQNTIAVTATSGENVIDGAGHGTIKTGDAYAGLNLVNVANTNFIDSKYLLVSLNAFQDINGDIVFPGLSSFFNSLNPNAATEHINNDAVVDNNVTVAANSGNNSSDTASSTTHSGNSISTTNVYNNINTNLSGGNTLHILLRVHGKWIGDILGGTDQFQALRDGSSLYLTNGSSHSSSNSTLNATNTTTIHNDVDVIADTGNNTVRNAMSAEIETGDAFAAANILNVANANVVGKNWMLAIINIFGDFNGNVAFGRPDLWVGEQISVPSKVENGTEVEYKFTVINNGDAESTGVVLQEAYDKHIDVLSSSHTYNEAEGGTLTWNIGTLPPGGATEITYIGQISGARPGTEITNKVKVTGKETDNNTSDNTETASFWTTEREIRIRPKKEPIETPPPVTQKISTTSSPIGVIAVTRNTPSAVVKKIEDKAREELSIRNTTQYPVHSVLLRDVLSDPEGNTVQTEEWDIGDLLPYEEVIVTYDIQFGVQATPGTYTLSTVLLGEGTTTQTVPRNGVVTLLAPEVVVIPLSIPVAEASTASSTGVIVPDQLQTPPEVPTLTAAASDSGFRFHGPLWLSLLAIGGGLVVGRKKIYSLLM